MCFRELQHAVSSLQKNVQMLKSEVSRYKTRAHKAEEKLNKLAVSSVHQTVQYLTKILACYALFLSMKDLWCVAWNA